jgi:hypothetical protein
MFNDWVARMKHERYLSSLIADSTPISNSLMLTFTSIVRLDLGSSPAYDKFHQKRTTTLATYILLCNRALCDAAIILLSIFLTS